MISEENISVTKTARFYLHSPKKNPDSVLFVLHGYGESAKDFINKFEFLFDSSTLIVAPEALSRFYNRSKIGASWMTKEDRINEIKDYVNYLNALFEKISNDYDISNAEAIIIGFSQGVHTAVRWFIQSPRNFNKLILCSSDFPSDADFSKLKSKLIGSKMHYVYGLNDPVFTVKDFESSLALLNLNGVNCSKVTFEGKHNIDVDSLKRIIDVKSSH